MTKQEHLKIFPIFVIEKFGKINAKKKTLKDKSCFIRVYKQETNRIYNEME